MMRRAIVALLTALLASSVSADSAEREIAHLLSAIGNSACVFIRNGKQHTAGEAVEHLEMKYRRAGRRVDTADMFIDRLASESSFSGKPYMIECDGSAIPSRTWLTEKLNEYRGASETAGNRPRIAQPST